jgi:ubiquinone/menaquinone biosynthesis C-methylase UbiE
MQNDYTIAAAATSLQYEHRLFLREMGALIPGTIPLAGIKSVLDVACGPGSWTIDLAKAYPAMHVSGVDKRVEMVEIARRDAAAIRVANVSFSAGDIQEQLPFADASFDFVHVQMEREGVGLKEMPYALRELLRVLRPGGWVNLLNFEPGPVSSPSMDILISLVNKALVKAGRGLYPDRLTFTIAVQYPRFLFQAGCVDVRYTLHPVDLGGWNNPAGRAYIVTTFADDNLIVPFLVKMGVTTQAEIESLLKKIRQEIQQIDFCGGGMIISVVGCKPERTGLK